MAEHIITKKVNVAVLVVLLALTVLTWRVAYVDLGAWNALLALLIAAAKATLVALFFMHALYASRRAKLLIVLGLFWLAIMLTLTFTDYLSRGWVNPEEPPSPASWGDPAALRERLP